MKEVEPKVYTVKPTTEQMQQVINAYLILELVDEIQTDWAVHSTEWVTDALEDICVAFEAAGMEIVEAVRGI
jgi:hypothetical protein